MFSIFSSRIVLRFTFFFQGDIINSLQSRLEIICEEAGLTDSPVSSGIESEKETSSDSVNCQSILNMLK